MLQTRQVHTGNSEWNSRMIYYLMFRSQLEIRKNRLRTYQNI